MKRYTKIVLSILLAMTMLVGFVGCKAQVEEPSDQPADSEAPAESAEPAAEENLTIGFIAMNRFMTWMQYALKGAEEVAAERGVELIIYDAENKVDKQTSLVEDLIAQDVDAIMTDPINVESLTPALKQAEEAGIPVVTFDRRAEGAPYFAFVGSDDVIGGRLAAQYIAEQIGGEGRVIEIVGAAGASPTIDRGNGFHDELETNYPDIEVVYSQTGEFTREQGMAVMEDAIIATGGDFDAVFAHNDDMMMGALQAMKDAAIDLDEVVTISYDGVPDALRAIEAGEHDATIQYPAGQAGMAMNIIIDYLEDETMPENKDDKIDPWVITMDNLDTGDFYPELSE